MSDYAHTLGDGVEEYADAAAGDVEVLADVIGTRNALGTIWVADPKARTHIAEIILSSGWHARALDKARAEGAAAERERIAEAIDYAVLHAVDDSFCRGLEAAARIAAARFDVGSEAGSDWDHPTMSRADCHCPNDCDCEGRFACEEPAGPTAYRCERVVGHPGWHRSGGHRWDRSEDSEAGS